VRDAYLPALAFALLLGLWVGLGLGQHALCVARRSSVHVSGCNKRGEVLGITSRDGGRGTLLDAEVR
jgi:hypothetical protein